MWHKTCFDQNYWPVTYSLKWIIETVILSPFPLGADYEGLNWPNTSRWMIHRETKTNLSREVFLCSPTSLLAITSIQCTLNKTPKPRLVGFLLEQYFSTFQILRPFNSVPHVMVSPTIKLFWLLPHNSNFPSIMNCNVTVWIQDI